MQWAALIELPVCMLLIAATRTGSISHLNPAAEASSNTLRVTCRVTKHIKNYFFCGEFAASCCCMLRNHKTTAERMLIFWMLFFPCSSPRGESQNIYSSRVSLNQWWVSLSWHIGSDLPLFLVSCMVGLVWAKSFHWCGSECGAAAAIQSLSRRHGELLTSLGLSWPRLWHGCHASLRGPDVEVKEGEGFMSNTDCSRGR